MQHNVEDIKSIFDRTFKDEYSTILSYGYKEPFYKARKSTKELSIIQSTEDYFASALHEISHWCLAGKDRRALDDYGYWYNPDGRNLDQQKEFENVEVKPQAIEMAFSEACSYPFKASADNLELGNYDSSDFTRRIKLQFECYKSEGLPKRAAQFVKELKLFYCH
ncbi:elongation factor P hydroxylase [Halobacteriovorax sp. HLS]|uniref:elongation factor P hydroxylase n=1 Tax=Halobacteriovorax sp. HLS TaxID=2234000 RepID=UPI000FDA811F|nr:elongation factor P hydroxylase [Halobacteriovorax sp. HLS]